MTWSEKIQRADKLVKGLGVCQMWGLGARVDRQGPSFCRRGSGAQLSSGDSTSLYLLSINQFLLSVLKRLGEAFINVSQAMVVPHSPLLLSLLGRASEKEQIVYLEGVRSEAVRKLLLL